MDQEQSEIVRKKYQLRHLLMCGKIILPYAAAKKLVGPDCAYHLYATYEGEK